MQTIQYIKGGKQVHPQNAPQLSIELNFDKDSKEATVTTNEWEFTGEETIDCQNYINTGLTGGNGLFEQEPFKIIISDGTVTETIFDGGLDYSDNAEIGRDRVRLKAKERQKIDFLNDRAPSVVWELYATPGTSVYDANFKDKTVFVPYVVNYIPDYAQSAMALLSAFVIEQSLQKSIHEIIELIGAVNVSPDPATIVQLVAAILYAIILILALIKLILNLRDVLIQPVKYQACMRVRDLLDYGFGKLGLTFHSDIYLPTSVYYNEVIMPKKFQNPVNTSDKRILGFTSPDKIKQPGYPAGTLADLLRGLKTKYNAKLLFDNNGNVFLVRQDYVLGSPQYQLKPIENRSYKTNADRIVSNYEVKFEYDTIDKNTIQEYYGTAFQSCIVPKVKTNQYMVSLKGLNVQSIPWALAKQKRTLTTPENVVKNILVVANTLTNGIITVVNAYISTYNYIIKKLNKFLKALKTIGITIKFQIKPLPKVPSLNLQNIITNRIGMLLLEHDFTSQEKIFLLTEGKAGTSKFNKVDANNDFYESAYYHYDNFHVCNSPIPYAGNAQGNQWIIREYSNFTFTFDDYLKVKTNNYLLMPSGTTAKIVSLKWRPESQLADAEVWINQAYTLNLKEDRIIPNAG